MNLPTLDMQLGYSEALADVKLRASNYVPADKFRAFCLMLEELRMEYLHTESGAPNPATYLVTQYERVEAAC